MSSENTDRPPQLDTSKTKVEIHKAPTPDDRPLDIANPVARNQEWENI